MQSDNIDLLATALSKAQASMGAAVFNRVNPHFKSKYADLASVLDAVRKPLTDNGLSVTQTMEVWPETGVMLLITTLRHTSGQWVNSSYPLPLNATPQALGSALTYARRYSLSSIACISADADDDANSAQEASSRAKDKISAEQFDELAKLIDDIGGDRRDNLEMGLLAIKNVTSLADIPAADFNDCVQRLKKTEVAQAKGKAK